MAKYPSQLQDKFNLRLPEGMKDIIAERAKANGRSINSEIIQMLQNVIDEDERMDSILTTDEEKMLSDPTLEMTTEERIEYYKEIDPAQAEMLKLQQKQWEETATLIHDLVNKGLLK
ncbi:Arc family DNA-binding protein [Providencia rettgeri]|uniref:Arc family DNA-binding protein n=1 Tax=Providencia rettgeri TaxID=587 RepID=UPI001B36579B|nr:Arc family DNA-binding protein [Providencia rettgeri]MBQ0339703.1 Arc family DNA-binding protein [Providencia rettgeri]